MRALVRDASRAARPSGRTSIAVGDLDDAESLAAAARGADGVFYMQLAPLPAQAQYMVQAAKTGWRQRRSSCSPPSAPCSGHCP